MSPPCEVTGTVPEIDSHLHGATSRDQAREGWTASISSLRRSFFTLLISRSGFKLQTRSEAYLNVASEPKPISRRANLISS
jgi:hypothetical protein